MRNCYAACMDYKVIISSLKDCRKSTLKRGLLALPLALVATALVVQLPILMMLIVCTMTMWSIERRLIAGAALIPIRTRPQIPLVSSGNPGATRSRNSRAAHVRRQRGA